MNDAERGLAQRTILKLVRVHNLLFLLIVVNALSSYLIVKATGIFKQPPAAMLWLNLVCIALPIGSLVVTAFATDRMIRGLVRRRGDVETRDDDAAECFQRGKVFAMILMTVSSLMAGTCLLFGHRVREVILVVVPTLLMFLTRPSNVSLLNFVRLIEIERDRQFPPDAEADVEADPAPDK